MVIVGFVVCAVKLYQTSELVPLQEASETLVADTRVPLVVVHAGFDVRVIELAQLSFAGGGADGSTTQILKVQSLDGATGVDVVNTRTR